MAPKLPDSIEVKAWLRRVLRPKTKLGKTTLWFGGLALILQFFRLVTRSPAGSLLSAWANFVLYACIFCALLMALRWVRRRMLWRLRNRLIVTYTFIGVIPIVLLVAMALIAGYLFAGQFATYVASAELQSQLHHLQSANASLGVQLRTLSRNGALSEQLASEIAAASAEGFRRRTVTVWEDDRGFVVPPERRGAEAQPIKIPPPIKGNFSGVVLDGKHLHLRAVRRFDEGPRRFIVVSNVPLTTEVLTPTASQLGAVTILPPETESGAASAPEPSPTSGELPPATAAMHPAAAPSRNHLVFSLGGSNTTVNLANDGGRVEAGQVPPPASSLDFRFPFATRFAAIDWHTGKPLDGLMLVDTRPSMLYAALFSTLGEKSRIFIDMLTGIAIFFGLIELVALVIGMRLTRSITKSVAELYDATEHINRGDLTYRIPVRTHDQMAALEQSFNSMSESLSRLIAEQKEKQRLESELAIAHEVQNLLFPADLSGLPSLEVHGVCRPARTVSGDYYDFIPLREDRLMLAVGDISGKGISAALLMATVHAFVRAYSLEPERTLASVALGAGVKDSDVLTLYGDGNGDSCVTPGMLMPTLNYQLYRSTPPEKYATLFLACYDARARVLTYSNAGHLPPLVLSGTNDVRRLDTSDTVVGLFDGVSYHENTVAMEPGDIFIAYSDGITEPENEFGEFGEDRLVELIQRHRDQPLARISDVVTGAVADWIAGGEQPDDVTLVLARAR